MNDIAVRLRPDAGIALSPLYVKPVHHLSGPTVYLFRLTVGVVVVELQVRLLLSAMKKLNEKLPVGVRVNPKIARQSCSSR